MRNPKVIFKLERELDDGEGIRGSLYHPDGRFLAYTMEPSRSTPDYPAILPGIYQLAWTPSNRLKRNTMELVSVPKIKDARKPMAKHPLEWRWGIRIHPLNFARQSRGCIGLGLSRTTTGNTIYASRKAVAMVEKEMRAFMQKAIPIFIYVE